MVFLGGAVLANIVSANKNPTTLSYLPFADGRQGRHVDIKAGVGGAGFKGVREAGRKIALVCSRRTTLKPIQFKQRATMLVLTNNKLHLSSHVVHFPCIFGVSVVAYLVCRTSMFYSTGGHALRETIMAPKKTRHLPLNSKADFPSSILRQGQV